MKQKLLILFARAAGKNVKTEADSACAFMAYQPRMPEAVRKSGKKTR